MGRQKRDEGRPILMFGEVKWGLSSLFGDVDPI